MYGDSGDVIFRRVGRITHLEGGVLFFWQKEKTRKKTETQMPKEKIEPQE